MAGGSDEKACLLDDTTLLRLGQLITFLHMFFSVNCHTSTTAMLYAPDQKG